MEKKNNFLKRMSRIAQMVFVSAFLMGGSGCDKNNPDNPDNSVPDPKGTVTMRIRNDDKGATSLNGIRIDDGNNFTGAFFVSLGGMKGLGNVTKMPVSGWSDKVAVKPGYGYVALNNNVFYRMYVEDYLYESGSSGIAGAEIKYQNPFTEWEGEGDLTFEKESIQVSERGDYFEILSNNSAPVEVHSVKSSETWCVINSKGYSIDNQKIVYKVGLSIEYSRAPEERTTEISFEYGAAKKTKKLLIKQAGVATSIRLSPGYFNPFSCVAFENQFVQVDSNAVWSVESTAAWCKVKKATYSGQKGVKIAGENNVSGENRTATLNFKDAKGKIVASLTVQQNMARIDSYPSNKEVLLESNHTSSQNLFSFYSELPLTIKSRESWCQIVTGERTGSYSIQISPCENLEGKERQGYVVAEFSPTLKDSILVKQKAHAFELSEKEVGFDRTMGAKTINVTTTASAVTFSCNKVWASGSWNAIAKQITVRVDANDTQLDRTAELTVILNDGQKKLITVKQNRYAPKDAYNVNGVKGVVFWVDGLQGKIVSEDKSAALKWSVENIPIGAINTKDGMPNTNVVKAINNWGTLYPAFKWCIDKGDGWYLPAYEEIILINQVTDLYMRNTLWSSTEYQSGGTMSYYVQGGRVSSGNKSTVYEVVAVYAFGSK